MTGSPQTDRRTRFGASEREWAAVLILCRYPEFIESHHVLQVRSMLAASDAADEASGVRRVSAQEVGLTREWRVVWKRREPGQIERATSEETALALAGQLSHIVGPTVRVEYRDVGEWTLHASSSPPAADSPVGGVS